MTAIIEQLIQALREELQQYGEMLALLDHQQEMVAARAADDVLQTVITIQTQSRVIEQARVLREELCAGLLLHHHLPKESGFAALIPLLPPDYQPLMSALVEENNALLGRIQQRARQNHLLLTRSLELLQRLISSFIPVLAPNVYNGNGRMMPGVVVQQPLYQAVG